MMEFYKDNFVKLYCADARDMLKFIPPESVHLVVTSPPYNVGKNYTGHNDSLPWQEYLGLVENVFRECYQVLVKGGRIAVNVPSCAKQSTDSRYAFMAVDTHNLLAKIGFLPREWITWVKRFELYNGTSWGSWKSPSNPYLRDCCEYIIVMGKEIDKLEGEKTKIDITKEEFLRYTTNVWEIRPETSVNPHPAPFPEELAYRLIKLYTYQGNVVLDPFMGSGTVPYVAKKTNRKGIGIDISKEYCLLAKNRCSQEFLEFDKVSVSSL